MSSEKIEQRAKEQIDRKIIDLVRTLKNDVKSLKTKDNPYLTKSTALTISSGEISTTSHSPIQFLVVDTEGSAASDILTKVVCSSIDVGGIVSIRQSDSARNIIIRNDNNFLRLGEDMLLDDIGDSITLMKTGTNTLWELSRHYKNVPSCRIEASSLSSITSGAFAPIPFNTELFDSHGFHDTVTNNTRITIPDGLEGRYYITGNLRFPSNSVGARGIRIYKTGVSSFVAAQQLVGTSTSSTTTLNVSCLLYLTTGDYVELEAYQSSGAGMTPDVVARYSPMFSAVLIAN